MNINTFNDVLGAKEIGIREILLDREGLSTYEDKIETVTYSHHLR